MPFADSARESGAAGSRLSPGSARSLLLTLLGEFALAADEPTWTSTFLRVLSGVGVAEKSARQALARAAAAGWIEGDRSGRRTAWQLTDRGRRLIAEGSQRVRSLSHARAPWDRQWLVLYLVLPTSHSTDRLKIYKALTWIGFGNPTPGLWVCPHSDRALEAARVIEQRGLAPASHAFAGTTLPFGVTDRDLVEQAWDLASVTRHYQSLVARFSALRPRSGDATLFAHVELVNALQRLPSIDPGLPQELLPVGWVGRRAAEKLFALRKRWHATAHERWRAIADDASD